MSFLGKALGILVVKYPASSISLLILVIILIIVNVWRDKDKQRKLPSKIALCSVMLYPLFYTIFWLFNLIKLRFCYLDSVCQLEVKDQLYSGFIYGLFLALPAMLFFALVGYIIGIFISKGRNKI